MFRRYQKDFKHKLVHLLVLRGLFTTEGIWEHGTIIWILKKYIVRTCVNPRLRIGTREGTLRPPYRYLQSCFTREQYGHAADFQ